MEKQPVSAESIARMADEEQDISSYFTNEGKMMPPLQSNQIDSSRDAIEERNEELSAEGAKCNSLGQRPR